MFKKVFPIIIFFVLNQHSLAVENVKIFEFTNEEMKTLQVKKVKGKTTHTFGSNKNGNYLKAEAEGKASGRGKKVKINLAKNAKSLGAHVFQCENYNDLENALKEAKTINKTTVIYTQCDRFHEVEGYSWWDVPVAETSKMNSVNKAYKIYLKQKKDQRFYN